MKSLLTILLLAGAANLAAGAFPDPDQVAAAMKKGAAFCREKLAVHGGYASEWSEDLSSARTEGNESKTVISIQPPGTTTLGLAFVKAYQATGDRQFLDAALAASQALLDSQLASGGWDSDFDFDPEKARRYHLRKQGLAADADTGKLRNSTTLDDNKTQSALLFLLELAHLPECKGESALQAGLKFGLDCLLAAQFPNGGWPQQYSGPADPSTPVKPAAYPKEWSKTFPKEKYTGYYTLNDGNMSKCVDLLLRAHELTGEARYLAAAKKAGEFFILAQMPEPQPVWAQQYNVDMEPRWARKFEPPSVSGSESVSTMRTLLDLWVVTGEERFRKPLTAALAWFDKAALPDGSFARFYELRTNKPLYFVKDTYELTYDDGNLPTHYSFKVGGKGDLDRIQKLLNAPREELLAKRQPPASEKSWASRAKDVTGKVQQALAAQREDGAWVAEGRIDASDITKHLLAMSTYVEAARKGGAAFAAMRAR